MSHYFRWSLALAGFLSTMSPATVRAAELMPAFSQVPTGWTTDRYAPNVFADYGTVHGRADVLGIEITSAQGFVARPLAFQSTFYNTQGMQHATSGGAGSILSADLYIPSSWGSETNGAIRTDMWGVMTDGTAVSDYTIIGFTNYGGSARYRVWDDTGWHDLSTTVAYDAWTAFSIAFTGSSYVYSINGNVVYTDTAIDGTTGFQAVIMQAYNFYGDSSLAPVTAVDYTAYWDNTTPVPVPAAVWLMGSAMFGLVAVSRRRSV